MKDKFLHNKVMVSSDVISLFTNIPVDYTINLILDKLFARVETWLHGVRVSVSVSVC